MEIENDNMNAAEPIESPQRLMCIYLKKPFHECYCMHMSSMNIPKILEFCAGEFRSCRIYQRNAHVPSSWQETHIPTLCHQNM